MNLPLVFRSEARTEFDSAADWYEQQRPGLGVEFVGKVHIVLDQIQQMPALFPVVYRDVRQTIVRRFPYSVLYRVESDQILIVAVFHSRRDPAVWKVRL
jgi:plasmid stabilization system protein ParE